MLAVFVVLLFAVPARALNPGVIDPTIELDADKKVLVSSLFTKRGEVIVELNNNTDHPIDLSGWSIRFATASTEADVMLPNGWLLSDEFVTLSENSLVSGVFGFGPLNLPANEAVAGVQVVDATASVVSGVSSFPADITSKWYQRKSTGVSGIFSNDFSAATTSTRLRHTPLYALPSEKPSLQVVEIYPRASACSPLDVNILCGDYIKLFNPTAQTAHLADFRLRSDSSTSESSNAFHLDAYQDVAPGGYLTVSLRDDGDKMNLTDSGGWIWLEDAEGITRYEETVVSYPSAGSDSKIGYAWALAGDGSWEWTPTPNPEGANSFPAAAPGMGSGVLGDTSTCPQGKYRNPETNRCRNIEDAIATLAACAEGQYRSPETNRCRSTTAAAAILTPCDPGQERNPATNRCRSTVASTGLTPCPAGQTRNPDTNRCKKSVLSAALSPAAIDPVKQQTSSPFVMTLLGIAGAGAIGYGIYEWRSELAGMLRKVASLRGKK